MFPKIELLIIMILALTIDISAQELSEVFFPDKSVSYVGQLGTNGKEHNGMGVMRLKKGGIYAGDFSRDMFHGYGIMILPSNLQLPYCKDASIYVGKWFRGKKNGLGKLYNSKGELIYNGKFNEDIPVDFDSNTADSLHRFSIVVIDEELYIGETIDGIPNGFGMFLDDDGYYTLCPVKDGVKNGVGIMLNPPYNWGVFEIKNELYYQIVTCTEQEAKRAKYKRNREAEKAELLNTFCNILNEGISIVNDFQNTTGSSLTEDYYNIDVPTNRKSKSSGSNTKSKFNLSEQENYNSDKATYSKYNGMLAAVFAGNRSASTNEIRDWQDKMRQIRKKWENKGRNFPYSPNEDK